MPTGLHGKLPAHGDFVRRALPEDFCRPWDAWLQASLEAAREALGEAGLAASWAAAPAWRFLLPAGACGPGRVAGVIRPSVDLVGRRFPLTLAASLAAEDPGEPWFAVLDQLGQLAQAEAWDADRLHLSLPSPTPGAPAGSPGWWQAPGHHWALPGLPPAAQFRVLLEGGG
ncbi:type VI secretion system-associated protein TagF [Falsiroseomonas selenitidurans]|uniref:Type VI secretion system-associated protein TagF n=1 Tax=Falsiroseomonas selenitidurans TaxID=2716335 RepID=A0ABX1ECK2_9PROT|nr:type VI secretion system-associated protein TagF [Falsiroseomonas selenitidurans]NKC34566.1 type VI secretion system-associated protein TagF [Falsiroseomonas selenitidurans]